MGSFDAMSKHQSFLELEGLHAFVTGSAGGIGIEVVNEFLGEPAESRVSTKTRLTQSCQVKAAT